MTMPDHTQTLKARLAAGAPLFGSLVTLASTDVAEIMALSGFDYLWIDLEHGAIDVTHAQRIVQAIGSRCPCLVRVPENHEVWFKKVLDLGCAGVVVPQVQTAEDVRAAVASCLYPPAGHRSVSVGRAQGYGTSFADYVQRANDDLLIVVQIEHRAAVANLDGILEVPGVGCLLVGPFDLSGSLGRLGQVTHPEVEAAIDRVRTACARAGMPCGIFTVDGESARARAAKGFRLIAIGTDAGLLVRGARDVLQKGRD